VSILSRRRSAYSRRIPRQLVGRKGGRDGRKHDSFGATLARDLARQSESEVTYPGQIKMTVIRELRASEYAR
jgi:hypothetical protein